jgi:predicted unusual protein kinase regulating ubiquinone biosynthesis (AarF/ABC1/UbiB family)
MPEEASAPESADPVQIETAHPQQTNTAASQEQYHLRYGRFVRIVYFFGLMFLKALFWEIAIKRIVGEKFVAVRRSGRFRHDARNFRKLAIGMGGVMIKLGQFVSTRVDVLPPEITEELEGLQDQVPVESFDYIKQTIEQEIGPIDPLFMWLNPEPVAAASFGQVHRAQLPNGDRVVVKVQRPGISDMVHTDLDALAVVARMAMRYGPIRRRANVPDLLEEFSRVLWEELDYLAEADHAMIFASMFEKDPGIYVPKVYLEHTTKLVLVLEDVTSIKLNDYGALERAGINRQEVANRLLNCYLEQVFDHRFFHADPHPGNIFVYPMPESAPAGSGANRNGKLPNGRPFYIIFIDFGMVGRLTPRLQEGLRETLISIATQDEKGLVASYLKLGVLLPGTDTKRVEAATRAVFDKVWGLNMSELANMQFEDMAVIAREFSDLLLSMPFQMPQDFIYLSRAVGILSGMCTGLDPQFDPWHAMQPFTEKLLSNSSTRTQTALGGGRLGVGGVQDQLQFAGKLVTDFFQKAYRLPSLADNVLQRAERGELQMQIAPDDPLKQQINRIETSVGQIFPSVVFATLTLAGTLLYINHEQTLGLAGFGFGLVVLVMTLLRGRD